MSNNTPTIGGLYLVAIDDEDEDKPYRAMYTADSSLPWIAENGSLYADEIVSVLRRLIVVDPADDTAVGPEIDLGNMDAGYVEIDGKGWVPSEDYERPVAAMVEATDRLTALTKASEFTRTDSDGTSRVIDAAKWVLTGE